MSSEIETMMYACGEVPWHGLGVFCGNEPISSSEAITAAGLDWLVETKDIYSKVIDVPETMNKVDGYKSIVRATDQKILGVTGNRYVPVQNIEAFTFMDSLVDEGLMRYHTAGSLRGGKNIWMLAKIGQVEILPGDAVDKFLFLYNSHDGSRALRCFFTATRVVCANTAAIALSEGKGQGLYLRHTASIHDKLVEGKQILGIAQNEFKNFEDFAKRLVSKQVTVKQVETFISALFPDPPEHIKNSRVGEKRELFLELFEQGIGQDIKGVAGTGWALYNALVEFSNYKNPARGKSAQERRFESSILGASTSLIGRGTQQLIQLAA